MLNEAAARWLFSLAGRMPATLFGWMPTVRIFRAPVSALKRSDQRRQEVVAIFGRKPPCAGRALHDGDKDVAA